MGYTLIRKRRFEKSFIEKGKLAERQGRKATGLKIAANSIDRRATEVSCPRSPSCRNKREILVTRRFN